MWATSQGVRTLIGCEADLVMLAVGHLRDMVTVGFELDDPHQSDVAIFNSLQPTQQLAVLHEVAFALLDPQTPTLELSAIREATVYVLFRELLSLVEVEIDISRDQRVPELEIRTAILESCLETSPYREQWLDEGGEGGDWLDPDMDDEDQVFPESNTSTDLELWEMALESLVDRILWDRDFELEALFADRDPSESQRGKQILGIEEDYFSVPSPDVFSPDQQRLDQELVRLISSNPSDRERVGD